MHGQEHRTSLRTPRRRAAPLLSLWLVLGAAPALAQHDPVLPVLAAGEPAPPTGADSPAAPAPRRGVAQEGARTTDSSRLAEPPYRALPAVAILWGAKALAATALDEFLDYALAALLGLPGPATADHLINLGANLVPYLGELRHLDKAARIVRVVEKVADALKPMRKLAKGHSKGSTALIKTLEDEAAKLQKAFAAGDLKTAKEALGRVIGYFREGQIALRLSGNGHEIVELGLRRLRNGQELDTEIDLVVREGGAIIFAQVKSMGSAAVGSHLPGWQRLTKQLAATVDAAAAYARLEGVPVRLRYYVDNISDEVRRLLEDHGVEVVLNATLLK